MKWSLALYLSCFLAGSLFAGEPAKPPIFQMRFIADRPSADSERMTVVHQSPGQEKPVEEVLNVSKRTLLDDSDVTSAKVQPNPITGKPQVAVTFNDHGRQLFAQVTRTHVNQRLGVLVDGRMVFAPVVRQEISSGKCAIDGNFSEKDAAALAERINKSVQERPNETK